MCVSQPRSYKIDFAHSVLWTSQLQCWPWTTSYLGLEICDSPCISGDPNWRTYVGLAMPDMHAHKKSHWTRGSLSQTSQMIMYCPHLEDGSAAAHMHAHVLTPTYIYCVCMFMCAHAHTYTNRYTLMHTYSHEHKHTHTGSWTLMKYRIKQNALLNMRP